MAQKVEKQTLGLGARFMATLGIKRGSVSPTKTIGSMGTSVYSGYVTESEENSALAGRTKYKTYSDILANVTIVSAGVRYFLNLLASAEWKVVPKKEADEDEPSEQAQEYADAIDDIIHGMLTPWRRVVKRAAMYKFYGFSVQEWTAKRGDEGVIGLLDIAPRPQITIERWDVDETGRVVGCVQRSPQTQEEIYLPRSKVVYLVDDSLNDSPEGLGLFRHIVEASTRLQRYQQLEGYGFETDLRGIPIVRIPYAALQEAVDAGTITSEKATEVASALEGFVSKHIKNPSIGMALDSATYTSTDEGTTPSNIYQYDIELLKGDGANFEAVGTAIERVNHEIARVLGVEQLLLGQSRGTQALSEDKSHNFALIVDSTLQDLQDVFESDIVDRMFELNGWDEELKPELITDKLQHKSVTEITGAIRDLATAGATLDQEDPAIDVIRDLLGLPEHTVKEMLEDAMIPDPFNRNPNDPNNPQNMDPNESDPSQMDE